MMQILFDATMHFFGAKHCSYLTNNHFASASVAEVLQSVYIILFNLYIFTS